MSDLIELNDKTLIDLLLEEQRRIDTPVGRFAETAEAARAETSAYQGLIPLSAPRPGEQLAFEVNLDKCSGCKGCVTACHSLNGLDEEETWRDVGLLVGRSEAHPFQQTVTSACHHCVDPACLSGCPVNAYEKDPVSGIVLHLDDQCIGCQYCVLKCPYDVPKFSEKRGVVRKCDMCHSRLSDGEAPACVQACPHEAIRIVTVDKEAAVAAASQGGSFLPDAPAADYTVPTTRYTSEKPLPENLRAADAGARRPQHTHWPLVLMLSLTQFGAGGFAISALLAGRAEIASLSLAIGLSWLLLHIGLGCSALHLGKPLKAWRIFLGLGHSWLSREAVLFGGVSALATAAAGTFAVEQWWQEALFSAYLPSAYWLLAATAVSSLAGVASSALIYVDTRRSFWSPAFSFGRFFGSTLTGAMAIGLLASPGAGVTVALANGLAAAGGLKLLLEWRSLRENAASRGLADGPLNPCWKLRLLLGAAAYAGAPAWCLFVSASAGAWAAIALVAASEVAERVLFFRAVNAPKMPGGVAW